MDSFQPLVIDEIAPVERNDDVVHHVRNDDIIVPRFGVQESLLIVCIIVWKDLNEKTHSNDVVVTRQVHVNQPLLTLRKL